MAGNNHMSIRQVELNGINPGLKRMLKGTIAIQREALAYLCGVSMDHWDTLGPLSRQKRLTMMEKLVHKTKDNPSPEYADFDTKFPKLPSYIRRALINAATGAASSFHTRLADYGRRKYAAMSDGKRFREKPPVFSPSNACIVLYKKQSFDRDGRSVTIKAFIRNSWQWVRVSMPSRDYKDLEKTALAAVRVFSPSLVYKNRKFYLAFPVDYGCAGFPERDIRHQKVLAADLGINRGAVFSVVDSRGNIHARMFDPFGRERAALESCIKAIRHVQKKSGHGQSLSKVYQKLDGLKDNYAKQLAHWIVMQAVQQGVYGIVLEYLGRMKGRGSKKDRIHHWCKCRILDYVKGLAFRYGIRCSLSTRRTPAGWPMTAAARWFGIIIISAYALSPQANAMTATLARVTISARGISSAPWKKPWHLSHGSGSRRKFLGLRREPNARCSRCGRYPPCFTGRICPGGRQPHKSIPGRRDTAFHEWIVLSGRGYGNKELSIP